MPLAQSCMHWRAFLGKLYKKERRVDGLAQAVGSGPGPGTLSPPVNGFWPLLLAIASVRKWFSSVLLFFIFFCICLFCFCRQSMCFVCKCENVKRVCGPNLSFTRKKKKKRFVEITEVLFPAFVVCFVPLTWSLCTQTIRCWESGLCLAPGSTLILAMQLFWGIKVSEPLV